MAKSTYRGSFGVRKRFKGNRVLPNGHPRASNGTAKIPSKGNLLSKSGGVKGVCKPAGSIQKSIKYEVGGGNLDTSKVGKTETNGRWVQMPRNCVRYIERMEA